MKKVGFLFSGQNSERVGMLKELYNESSIVRRTFEEASDILNFNVQNTCFEGDGHFLRLPTVSAPVILTANVASFRHLMDRYAVEPSLMAGHSLGEYGALTCADVFSFSDALSLVTYRAELAQRASEESNSVMTIIYNFDYLKSEELCRSLRLVEKSVWISCYNSSNQVAISGKEADITVLELLVAKKGGAFKRLGGKSPFHCPLLNDVTEEFARCIKSIDRLSPLYPVIANYSVLPYTSDNVGNNLVQHLVKPVRWVETMSYMKRQNINLLVELGSGVILSRLVESTASEIQVINYETADHRKQLDENIFAELVTM